MGDPINLLRQAENYILQMQKENQSINELLSSVMTQQQNEADEIARLFEQLRKLETLLSDVTKERDDIRLLLGSLREDMQRIRDVAAQTLKRTRDKDSLMDMAVKFYEVKTLADSVKFIKD